MSYPRNAASPDRVDIGPVIQISDGAVQTSGVSVKVIPFGGTEVVGAGTVAYSADGVVLYTPTQGETDCTSFILVASKTGCFPVSKTVVTSASGTAGYVGLDWSKITAATTAVVLTGTTISASQVVSTVTNRVTANADQWGGFAVTGMPMPTYEQPTGFLAATFPAVLASTTNITAATGVVLATGTHTGARIPNVTLVDTTTTNSDMRGTDGALPASWYDPPLSASQTRAALGLASANLDTQLGDIPTVAEFETRTLTVANYATATNQIAIKAVTDKLSTALMADGLTWKFTVNALSNAPDGGGGGGGSATLENQTAILQSLASIQGTGFASAANSLVELTSSINTGINSIITQSTPTIGTIVGFPAKLHIGDSYTTATGNAITVYLRDANGNPITAVGSKQFTDPDFTPTLVISQANGVGRVEAIVSYHAPQNAERYLRVQIPSSRSRRGYAGVATMQATLRWSDSQMTLATQAVEWIPQI